MPAPAQANGIVICPPWPRQKCPRAAVGVAVAARPCLRLALLEIGAQLLGKPRLAVGLGRAA